MTEKKSKLLQLLSGLLLVMLSQGSSVNTAVKIGPHIHYFALEGSMGSKFAPSKGHPIGNITEGVEIENSESES